MIGAWMLYCVWVALLLALAAFAIERALRFYDRAGRLAWVGALAGSVLLPLWSWIAPGPPAGAEGSAAVLLGQPFVLVGHAGAAGGSGPLPISLAELDLPLVLFWIAASAAIFGYLLWCGWRLHRRRARWSEARVGGSTVLLSPDAGPAVVGLLRGTVVMPEWVLEVGDRARELMLAHEREHLRGRDPWLLLAGLATLVFMPWNPGLWWQMRRLRLAVEVDCDRRVLQAAPGLREYAELLLEVGRRSAQTRGAVVAFSEPTSFLERRVEAMTRKKPQHRSVQAAGLSLLAIFGLVLACDTPAPETVAPSEEAMVPEQTASDLAIERSATFDHGAQPLILLDGEVAEDLDSVDPERIESITVLKGAKATERYGARAEHGVIIIDTRDGADAADAEGDDNATLQVLSWTPPDSSIEGPHFTPMTARPSLDNATEVRAALEEAYPSMLRDAGIGGTVMVWLFIDEGGQVVKTQVRKSSGREALDRAALAVAETMEFTPARNEGEPVSVWIALPITFQTAR